MPKTNYTYLKEFVQAMPDSPILGWDDVWMTNTQLLERMESTAWALRQKGVKKGDMVALTTSRSPEAVIVMMALQTIGAVAVLCDPHNKIEQFLSEAAVEIPATYALTNEDTTRGLWDGKDLVFVDRATGEKTPMDVLSLPSHACPEGDDVDPTAAGFVVFTSGSTGKRKAVLLSQAGIEATLHANYELAYYCDYDIALGCLPMDHIFGLILMTGTMILRHALYLTKDNSIATLLQTIQDKKITRTNGTPQLFMALAGMKDKYDLSSLQAGLIGGAPFTAEQFCTIENELGIHLSPIYAMSEYTHIAVGNWRDPQEYRARSNGGFCAMNHGVILRADGTEAGVNEIGEICVDGPARMVGYFGEPESFSGMIHTGDLGFVDERGYLHISGRLKDIIIRNGNNLAPRRIEEAILSVPGVTAVCVKGVPNQKQGEVPCAYVVAPGVSQETIETHIAQLLHKNELPEGYLFGETMPLLSSGKPDKQGIQKTLTQAFGN